MERGKAREQAVLCVFEYGFTNGEKPEEFLERAVADRGLRPSGFMKQLTLGALTRADELDAIIDSRSQGWDAKRIARLHRAVMRVALYEMMYVEVPHEVDASGFARSVAMNEALELCRAYAGEEGVSFVNGVLSGWSNDNPAPLPPATPEPDSASEPSGDGDGHE